MTITMAHDDILADSYHIVDLERIQKAKQGNARISTVKEEQGAQRLWKHGHDLADELVLQLVLTAFRISANVLIAKDLEADRQSTPAKRDGCPQDLPLTGDGALVDDHRQVVARTKAGQPSVSMKVRQLRS